MFIITHCTLLKWLDSKGCRYIKGCRFAWDLRTNPPIFCSKWLTPSPYGFCRFYQAMFQAHILLMEGILHQLIGSLKRKKAKATSTGDWPCMCLALVGWFVAILAGWFAMAGVMLCFICSASFPPKCEQILRTRKRNTIEICDHGWGYSLSRPKNHVLHIHTFHTRTYMFCVWTFSMIFNHTH